MSFPHFAVITACPSSEPSTSIVADNKFGLFRWDVNSLVFSVISIFSPEEILKTILSPTLNLELSATIEAVFFVSLYIFKAGGLNSKRTSVSLSSSPKRLRFFAICEKSLLAFFKFLLSE